MSQFPPLRSGRERVVVRVVFAQLLLHHGRPPPPSSPETATKWPNPKSEVAIVPRSEIFTATASHYLATHSWSWVWSWKLGSPPRPPCFFVATLPKSRVYISRSVHALGCQRFRSWESMSWLSRPLFQNNWRQRIPKLVRKTCEKEFWSDLVGPFLRELTILK